MGGDEDVVFGWVRVFGWLGYRRGKSPCAKKMTFT